MWSFLVRGGRGFVPVDFHEDKPIRIFAMLDDVEPRDSRFFEAVLGIFNRRVTKRVN